MVMIRAIIRKYFKKRKSFKYRCLNRIAGMIINFVTFAENRNTRIIGIENIKSAKNGAVITSNHFNPIDNTAIRKCVKKAGHKRLFIVSQETNLAMKGIIGFIINYADIIPISSSSEYMGKYFEGIIHKLLKRRHYVLIYPEPDKNVRENSVIMMEKDYELKKAAYERAYGKKLTYKFEKTDIAGWI